MPGLGRGLRQSSRAAVLVRDGAVQVARRAQYSVPARGDHRHPLGQPGELRHRENEPQRVARIARHRRHPRRLHHAGRHPPARHPQLAGAARQAGSRTRGAAEDSWRGERGRGVRRHLDRQ